MIKPYAQCLALKSNSVGARYITTLLPLFYFSVFSGSFYYSQRCKQFFWLEMAWGYLVHTPASTALLGDPALENSLRAPWNWAKGTFSLCLVNQVNTWITDFLSTHNNIYLRMIIMSPHISRTVCIFSEDFQSDYLCCLSQGFSLWNSFAYFICL